MTDRRLSMQLPIKFDRRRDNQRTHSGGFILLFEPHRGRLLYDQILEQGRFTDTFSAEDWDMNEAEVCLLSLEGRTFDFACLGHRRRRVATAKFRVSFTDFVDLQHLEIQLVQTKLRSQVRSHFTNAASGVGARVADTTWKATLVAIRQLRPALASALDALLALQAKRFDRRAPQVEVQMAVEKDNAGVALDIFDATGELRRETFEKWEDPAEYAPPFMSGIKNVQLREAQMIFHDMGIFPGGEKIPSATGTRFVIGDRTLDLVYANQTDVEESLGADLVYYNSRFRSYTVVQYKRMYQETLENKKVFTFRPSKDASFKKELQRMQQFCTRAGAELRADPHDAYRLAGHGFFFKFCPLIFAPDSTALISGMYVPWDFLTNLLEQRVVKGPQEGPLLTFHNVPRYFNNTNFTQLVRDGWVGTRGNATEQVTEIIQAALGGRRAVILAVEGTQGSETEGSLSSPATESLGDGKP